MMMDYDMSLHTIILIYSYIVQFLKKRNSACVVDSATVSKYQLVPGWLH